MYLVYCLAAIAVSTYFWSWSTAPKWVAYGIALTGICAGSVGIYLAFGEIAPTIGVAWVMILVTTAIAGLGRTFYDQIHYPAPTLSF